MWVTDDGVCVREIETPCEEYYNRSAKKLPEAVWVAGLTDYEEITIPHDPLNSSCTRNHRDINKYDTSVNIAGNLRSGAAKRGRPTSVRSRSKSPPFFKGLWDRAKQFGKEFLS